MADGDDLHQEASNRRQEAEAQRQAAIEMRRLASEAESRYTALVQEAEAHFAQAQELKAESADMRQRANDAPGAVGSHLMAGAESVARAAQALEDMAGQKRGDADKARAEQAQHLRHAQVSNEEASTKEREATSLESQAS